MFFRRGKQINTYLILGVYYKLTNIRYALLVIGEQARGLDVGVVRYELTNIRHVLRVDCSTVPCYALLSFLYFTLLYEGELSRRIPSTSSCSS